jgi:hypothetical protein
MYDDTIKTYDVAGADGLQYRVRVSPDDDRHPLEDAGDDALPIMDTDTDWDTSDAEEFEEHCTEYEPSLEEVARLRMLEPVGRWARHAPRQYVDVMRTAHALEREGVEPAYALEIARGMTKWLQGWYNDDWHYVGITVTALDERGDETDDEQSLCGIEWDESADDHEKDVAEYVTDLVYECSHARRRAAHPNQMELNFYA